MPAITPSLWFNNNLEEAVNFYTAVFPNSKIESIERQASGEPIMGTFELDGNRFESWWRH